MKRTKIEREVDEETIRKGRKAIEDYDETQEITVHPPKLKSRSISIRIPTEMMHALFREAERRDMGYQQLIKRYITEGLMGLSGQTQKVSRFPPIRAGGNFVYVSASSTGPTALASGSAPMVREESLGGLYGVHKKEKR